MELDDGTLLTQHGETLPSSTWIRFKNGEFITGFSGTWGIFSDAGATYVMSIAFRISNVMDGSSRLTDVYGGPGDNPFSFTAPPEYHFVGFYGRSGGAIDQIGGIFKLGR